YVCIAHFNWVRCDAGSRWVETYKIGSRRNMAEFESSIRPDGNLEKVLQFAAGDCGCSFSKHLHVRLNAATELASKLVQQLEVNVLDHEAGLYVEDLGILDLFRIWIIRGPRCCPGHHVVATGR